MSQDFRTGRSVVYELHAHIVLTPKYRRGVFSDAIRNCVKNEIQKVCDKNDVILEEFNTDHDHAHLVISYTPNMNLSVFIGQLKGSSSRAVRKLHWDEVSTKLWGNSFWSPSYFVSSTGGAPLEKVKKYVEKQGKNPRKKGNPNFTKSDSSPH